MGAWEICTIIFAVLVVLGVAISSFVKKKKGKSSCGCDCSSCPHCSNCHSVTQKKEELK